MTNRLIVSTALILVLAAVSLGNDVRFASGKSALNIPVQLGNIKVENPVTMFSQARNGALSSPDYSGQIGNAILRRFKVVFDYSRKLMILESVKNKS